MFLKPLLKHSKSSVNFKNVQNKAVCFSLEINEHFAQHTLTFKTLSSKRAKIKFYDF